MFSGTATQINAINARDRTCRGIAQIIRQQKVYSCVSASAAAASAIGRPVAI